MKLPAEAAAALERGSMKSFTCCQEPEKAESRSTVAEILPDASIPPIAKISPPQDLVTAMPYLGTFNEDKLHCASALEHMNLKEITDKNPIGIGFLIVAPFVFQLSKSKLIMQ